MFEMCGVSDQIFWIFFLGNEAKSPEIDNGISQAVRNSDKISMMKNIFGGRLETTLTAENLLLLIEISSTLGRTAAASSNNLVIFL